MTHQTIIKKLIPDNLVQFRLPEEQYGQPPERTAQQMKLWNKCMETCQDIIPNFKINAGETTVNL